MTSPWCVRAKGGRDRTTVKSIWISSWRPRRGGRCAGGWGSRLSSLVFGTTRCRPSTPRRSHRTTCQRRELAEVVELVRTGFALDPDGQVNACTDEKHTHADCSGLHPALARVGRARETHAIGFSSKGLADFALDRAPVPAVPSPVGATAAGPFSERGGSHWPMPRRVRTALRRPEPRGCRAVRR